MKLEAADRLVHLRLQTEPVIFIITYLNLIVAYLPLEKVNIENIKNNEENITKSTTKINLAQTFLQDISKQHNDINNSENVSINAENATDINTVLNKDSSTLERSKPNDSNPINSVGVEILKNMTTKCGYYLGKRISFGRPTTLMQYPWTALLVYNTPERYHCGGSLITFKYVLTAAHCVSQELYELTSVRLGEHDITTEKDCAENVGGEFICSNTIDVGVDKIIIHHDYSHFSHGNDIALLRLQQMIDFTRSYYPICLPTPDEDVLSQHHGTIAGWGATEKSLRSNVLLMADVPILDMAKCREVYNYTKFNDTTEMCGSGTNEIDVCKGDSGGAIFYDISGRRQKSKFYQMGIISLGVRSCGEKRFYPAVFTKLPAYIKWIENNLEI